jgi:GDPmannose 4,6-dehydratase
MLAIVSGITGQDGAYLAKLLLGKGYKVVGLARHGINTNLRNLNYLGIAESITLVNCDLTNITEVREIVVKFQPNEIYNLAALSSVGLSFSEPIETLQFNIISVINFLEVIRTVSPKSRFYQASSSEMFGCSNQLPISLNSVIHPLSPYAISKVTGHYTTINYRESYNLYSCCGVLFNHESYLRSENFFVKKLLKGALDIKSGKLTHISFGNLDVKRDFGYSPNYVEAMWLMLQQDTPKDYMICTGKSLSLLEIVEYVFVKLGISKFKIKIDKNLFRPTDIYDIYGDNSLAVKELNWNVQDDFFKVIDLILDEEIQNYEK